MRFDRVSSVPDGHLLDRPGQTGSSLHKGRVEQGKTVSDEAQLSASRSSVEALKAELTRLPDVRQDRVQALQAALRDGTFQVTDQQLANAILGDFFGPETAGKQ